MQNVLLSAYVPIIVDADGLNAVAQHPHLSGYFTENVIVTPHLGEMARLTGHSIEDLKRDLVESAVRYGEEKGVTCVLKDAVTVTAGRDGNVYIGDSGCAAMAKGGSGDVLTGVIAGLLALGFSEDEAAALGVFLHAELMPGIEIVMEETHLEEKIKNADFVVTGEGRLDAQTAMGKAPVGVAKLAKKYHKPVIAFAGGIEKGAEACNKAGITAFFPAVRGVTTLDEAMRPETAAENLAESAEQVFRLLTLR